MVAASVQRRGNVFRDDDDSMGVIGNPDFRLFQELRADGVFFWVWAGMLLQQTAGEFNRSLFSAAIVVFAD